MKAIIHLIKYIQSFCTALLNRNWRVRISFSEAAIQLLNCNNTNYNKNLHFRDRQPYYEYP